MAEKYECNIEKAKTAALLHDIAKKMTDEEFFNLVKEKDIN